MASAQAYGRIPVPSALISGVQLQVIDLDVTELVITAGSNGQGAQATNQLPQGFWLRVERIVVISDSTATPEVTVYEGDETATAYPQRGRDWTQLPPGFVAVAEYPSYLTIRPTQSLAIGVSGAHPGDVFFASVQYQLVTKVKAVPGVSGGAGS